MPPPLRSGWTLQNYVKITHTPFFRHLFNSLIVSTLTTVFALRVWRAGRVRHLTLSLPARGRCITFWILHRPSGPAHRLCAAALQHLCPDLGLNNTYPGIILAYLTFTVPLVIWILRPFLDNIPIDMEEAAVVDGASNLQVFFRVVVPLAAPGPGIGRHPHLYHDMDRVLLRADLHARAT